MGKFPRLLGLLIGIIIVLFVLGPTFSFYLLLIFAAFMILRFGFGSEEFENEWEFSIISVLVGLLASSHFQVMSLANDYQEYRSEIQIVRLEPKDQRRVIKSVKSSFAERVAEIQEFNAEILNLEMELWKQKAATFDFDDLGPTALCRDGTYSYSQIRQGPAVGTEVLPNDFRETTFIVLRIY